MKPIFENVILNYSEYSYFKQLPVIDQIQYFFEIYELHDALKDGETDTLDLKSFFESVHSSLSDPELPIEDDDLERVDVTLDDDNIMIESNSLRAVRHVTNKFMESGYIIQRDIAIEKMFKKDKVTRYIRVFRIIDFITGICLN
jgi:hypothetical protein